MNSRFRRTGALLAAVLLMAHPAAALPKKALGDYSKLCQDEHLTCLNDCQRNYPSDADALTCMGVCNDWLDDACDVVFPKALVNQRGTVGRPTKGTLDPGPRIRKQSPAGIPPKVEKAR